MTILLIAAGVMGKPELAAEIAIVQGVTLAVFLAFSANARSVILRDSSKISWLHILRSRLILLVPLGEVALIVSLYVTEATPLLALALVLRRCSEWISEVYLARKEYERNYGSALWFTAIQSLLLAVAIISIVFGSPFWSLGIFLWAIVPVVSYGNFLRSYLRSASLLDSGWVYMLPHFGSTVISGVTVFVFRLVILSLVGKMFAGNLFTAFAIGGMLGTIFSQALGPTLVFHAREGRIREIPNWLKLALLGSVSIGTGLVFVSMADWWVLAELGRPAVFWSAIGASLLGGAVMVFAQRLRLRLLQHQGDRDVFGPDLLTNIFIVAVVPYAYALLGIGALSWLFLINAVIAMIFYFSAYWTAQSGREIIVTGAPIFGIAIAVGLLFPLFFQLTGGIFSDQPRIIDGAITLVNSGGDLRSLPIPISVLVCYGTIVLIGKYNRARVSLSVIFLCFCLMLISSMLSTHDRVGLQQAKIILLIQFILPMLALVLGQTYGKGSNVLRCLARASLYVIALVIPLQLAATWEQGFPFLTPYLYIFSIYQHLQYVPMILVCAFTFSCFSLWPDRVCRTALMMLSVPMGIYAMLSLSVLTIGGLLVGAATFFAYWLLYKRGKQWKNPLLLLLMIIAGAYGAIPVVENTLRQEGKISLSSGSLKANDGTVSVTRNISERMPVWNFYIDEIVSSDYKVAFGHQRPPDRKLYPSAHNYYLDFIYNFGLVALGPILWLIAFTLWKTGRNWKEVLDNPGLCALIGVVLFLVLVDNSLTVGLRQPYPGIITFFLWGVLLSRLCAPEKTAEEDIDITSNIGKSAVTELRRTY